jgi:NAD(P)-dependent dehydrogenase (short-subunit alcohol dehydrogenase family)
MAAEQSGAVALVTGAASGIGGAAARLIAPGCRHLVLHGRATKPESKARLEATAAACSEMGPQVLTLTGDLAEPGVGKGLVEQTVARCGGLDHLVSNAGFADKRSVAELGRADVDRSYATMTGAFFEMAQAAMPALKESTQGRIILVSSFVAHRFARGGLFPASAAAKAGAEALARSLAAELAPSGVTVNAVVPGYTRKDSGTTALSADAWAKAAEITPLGRIGDPADVAALIAFLLSPAARHITGQSIAVDGGLSLG